MGKLKPRRCPFCKAKAKVMHLDYGGGRVWGVFCKRDLKDEYGHGHYVDNHESREAAIKDWNGTNQ